MEEYIIKVSCCHAGLPSALHDMITVVQSFEQLGVVMVKTRSHPEEDVWQWELECVSTDE